MNERGTTGPPPDHHPNQGWRFRHSRITLRMLVVPCVVILLVQGLLSIVFAYRSAEISEAREHQRLTSLIESRAELMGPMLWNFQYEQLDALINDLGSDPAIGHVAIYDDAGTPVRGRMQGIDRGSKQSAPIVQTIKYRNGNIDVVAGRAEVLLNHRPALSYLSGRLLEAAALMLAAASAICLILWFSVRRNLGTPLGLLADAIDRSNQGQGRVQVDWQSGDELGLVVSNFNAMQARTEQQEQELLVANQRLNELAGQDELTGLANLRALRRRLHLRGGSGDDGGSLLYVDLAGFKDINDTLGPTAGDELLRRVGQELARTMPADGLLARVGGDEFVGFIERPMNEVPLRAMAEQMLRAVRQAGALACPGLPVEASIGAISTLILDCRGNDLVQLAVVALRHAKAGGPGRAEVLTVELRDQFLMRRQLERDLDRALDGEDICFFFQPQVDLQTGRVESVEALVRWRHPTLGLIPPDRFLPIIDELGWGRRLTEQTVRQACLAAQRLLEIAGREVRVGFNLSAQQLCDGYLVDRVAGQLEAHQLCGSLLEVEVTESSLIRHLGQAREILTALRALGARTALDDFGVGYSSLSYLRDFPIDRVKIDRSFVNQLSAHRTTLTIVHAIARLAAELGLDVVAEGVETPDEVTLLRGCGIELAQGYLYARPMPFEELVRFITVNQGDARPASTPAVHDTPAAGRRDAGAVRPIQTPEFAQPAAKAREQHLRAGAPVELGDPH